VRRASEAQRARLHETFAALCRIESPSGHERECAEWVSAELASLGVEVEEDRGYAGSDAGNLLARFPSQGGPSILLCAHLDTVPLTAPVEPVVLDGAWENAGDGILGADNKAAIAVILELARMWRETPGLGRTGVELLFTVSEEDGLNGAKAFDVSRLRSEFGYVFDHASPIGEIIVAAPTYARIAADIRGRAAHAGIRPEDGRSAIVAAARAVSAMPLGRLDAETTANVGTIAGGTATNVVPEHCRLEAEVRGLDERRVEAVVTEVIDHLHDAVNAGECDLDLTTEILFHAYRTRRQAPEVVLAERALTACGYQAVHVATGGGSDANALRTSGFPCVNLANGTERNHQPDERVSIDALEGMLEVVIALVHMAGQQPAAERSALEPPGQVAEGEPAAEHPGAPSPGQVAGDEL
jgi:tripeptide aminopeptidase